MHKVIWSTTCDRWLKETGNASILSAIHSKAMKKDWSNLDKYRLQKKPYLSPVGATYGAFEVPYYGASNLHKDHRPSLRIIATSAMPELGAEGEWEHVSVHAFDPVLAYQHGDGERTPTWQEMAFIKDLFWKEDECVVQFHPAKKDYVNIHSCVLHMWRSTKTPFPMPPKICV